MQQLRRCDLVKLNCNLWKSFIWMTWHCRDRQMLYLQKPSSTFITFKAIIVLNIRFVVAVYLKWALVTFFSWSSSVSTMLFEELSRPSVYNHRWTASKFCKCLAINTICYFTQGFGASRTREWRWKASSQDLWRSYVAKCDVQMSKGCGILCCNMLLESY